LGPTGIGVLHAKDSLLEGMPPVIGGGDMIRSVTFEESSWNEIPWKFEAGTPNIEGAIGFGAAIDYLNHVGMGKIRAHDTELTEYALKALDDAGASIYGINSKEFDGKNRLGVISFKIAGAHPHDIATIFNSEGVAIRAGHHCAMPLVNKVLMEPALARMSFYLYNTQDEIDKAALAIEKVRKVLKLKI